MYVRFKANFDWTPPRMRRISMVYPSGYVGSVTHDCGEAAIAAGKAERVDPPPREERKPIHPRRRIKAQWAE